MIKKGNRFKHCIGSLCLLSSVLMTTLSIKEKRRELIEELIMWSYLGISRALSCWYQPSTLCQQPLNISQRIICVCYMLLFQQKPTYFKGKPALLFFDITWSNFLFLKHNNSLVIMFSLFLTCILRSHFYLKHA